MFWLAISILDRSGAQFGIYDQWLSYFEKQEKLIEIDLEKDLGPIFIIVLEYNS